MFYFSNFIPILPFILTPEQNQGLKTRDNTIEKTERVFNYYFYLF
ncbi:MAG: hypothetical protein QG646_764 [Euryarchaeota archaeon]|nr:hypothetical protein [Euryarchaeota archaeon]